MSMTFQKENRAEPESALPSAGRFRAIRFRMSAAILYLFAAALILAGEYWLAGHVGLIGVIGPAPAIFRPKWQRRAI